MDDRDGRELSRVFGRLGSAVGLPRCRGLSRGLAGPGGEWFGGLLGLGGRLTTVAAVDHRCPLDRLDRRSQRGSSRSETAVAGSEADPFRAGPTPWRVANGSTIPPCQFGRFVPFRRCFLPIDGLETRWNSTRNVVGSWNSPPLELPSRSQGAVLSKIRRPRGRTPRPLRGVATVNNGESQSPRRPTNSSYSSDNARSKRTSRPETSPEAKPNSGIRPHSRNSDRVPSRPSGSVPVRCRTSGSSTHSTSSGFSSCRGRRPR